MRRAAFARLELLHATPALPHTHQPAPPPPPHSPPPPLQQANPVGHPRHHAPSAAGRGSHPLAGAHRGGVVVLVRRDPLGERDVVRVDHHRVGHREGLAVHDHARWRVEQLHPLRSDQRHARVLGDPGALLVQLGHNRLGLSRAMHGGRRLLRVEAIGHPAGHVVPLRDSLVEASGEARLVERDNVPALPVLERIIRVQEQLVLLAAVRAHHHGQVCQK